MFTRRGVTLRAVLLGLVTAVFVNVWITYAEYVVHASRMNLAHFPVALFAAYLLLVVFTSRCGFSAGETATVFAMGLVATAVPTSGLMGFWLGALATPFYFATPENRWAEFYHPNIPPWFAPRNTGHSIEWFYNGVPPGAVAPWHDWVIPLLWWLSLIAAIVILSLAIAALLRKPWVENERLVFPIAEVGMLLARTDQGSARLPTIFRSRLFWAGFSLPFLIFVWNSMGFFQAGWPALSLNHGGFVLFRGFPYIQLRFNFLTLGLCYFANTATLLSLWVFFLLVGFQTMIFNRIGYTVGALGDDWSSINPMAAWESFGALTMLVVWGLWTAREHLRAAWRAAIRGGTANDDQRELLSFRVAIFGGAAALLYILAWLHAAGMAWSMAFAWTFATIIVFIGVARIVSETGLPYVRGPLTPQSFAAYGLGTANYSSASVTVLTFSYAFLSQGKGLFLTPFMHGAKLASAVPSARKMATAIVAAMAAGIIVCLILTLYLGYTMGAYNFQDYPFSAAGRHMFILGEKYLRSPMHVAWDRWSFFGIGAAAMMALTWLRYQFHWWPLSPLGLTIATTYPTIQSVLMVFVAWAVKTIILHIGGVRLYNRSKPYFLGLAGGYAAGVAFSFLVDLIWFPGAGHGVHSW